MVTILARETKQIGSTIAEFVVVTSFVLVPMLLLMPLLGKYIDTQHKVEQAARYGAWEHTAWFDSASPAFTGRASGMLPFTLQSKDAAEIENEIQHRILAKSDTPLHADQGQGNHKYELDTMQQYTRRSSRQYQALLIKDDDKSTAYGSYTGSDTKTRLSI